MTIQMTGFLIVESELQRDIEKTWADDISLLDATLDAERITSINKCMLVCIETCNEIQVRVVEAIFLENSNTAENSTLSKCFRISKLATHKSI